MSEYLGNFWQGTFIVKHLAQVAFVPVESMSPSDWEVLDYPELRPAAKENLVRNIVTGKLRGFFRVNYDMHKSSHGGKPTYYYPASEADADRFAAGDYPESNFRNFKDYDKEVDFNFPEYERRERELSRVPSSRLVRFGITTFTIVQGGEDEPTEAEYAAWPEWAQILFVITELHTADRAELVEIAATLGIGEEDLSGMSEDEIIDRLIDELLAQA